MKKQTRPAIVVFLFAVVTLSLAGSVSAQGVRTFLRLDGVPGESTFAAFRDAIDVVGCSFDAGSDIENLLTSALEPGISPLVITKKLDKASPLLFLHSLEGTELGQATVSMRAAGAAFDFLVLSLNGVRVAKYGLGASNGAVPAESITLSYKEIEVKYTPLNSRGQPGTPISRKFRLQ